MPVTLIAKIEGLRHLAVRDLQAIYTETFGHAPGTRNRDHLWRRIAWELQAQAHGGLAESTQERASQLIAQQDPLGRTALKPRNRARGQRRTGARVPRRGTVIVREYKGERHEVLAVEDGFQHRGQVYRSLSAVAKIITGAHWNGPLFFGLR